jgi:hypothetical protein
MPVTRSGLRHAHGEATPRTVNLSPRATFGMSALITTSEGNVASTAMPRRARGLERLAVDARYGLPVDAPVPVPCTHVTGSPCSSITGRKCVAIVHGRVLGPDQVPAGVDGIDVHAHRGIPVAAVDTA